MSCTACGLRGALAVNIIPLIRHNMHVTYALNDRTERATLRPMREKPMTVTEFARMGGLARAKAHSKKQIREWGRRGGRPPKFTAPELGKLRKWLAAGKTQAQCAEALGVSTRTAGRAVQKLRAAGGSTPRRSGTFARG